MLRLSCMYLSVYVCFCVRLCLCVCVCGRWCVRMYAKCVYILTDYVIHSRSIETRSELVKHCAPNAVIIHSCFVKAPAQTHIQRARARRTRADREDEDIENAQTAQYIDTGFVKPAQFLYTSIRYFEQTVGFRY